MEKSLGEIARLLDSHIEEHEARVYTFVETGYDETGVVATTDGFLRLAKELTDFVAAAQQGEL